MPGHAEIRDLLEPATAAVSRDEADAERIGTAFRVAPDYAVTAAHVVPPDPRARVRLEFGEGSACGATVVAADPPDRQGRWTFEDLAVLRLERPDEVAAPCVLMADALPDHGDELVVCALNAAFPPRVLELYDQYRVRETHSRQNPPFFTVDGSRAVVKGMSGGPVWSVRHGGVIGLVKASEHIGAAQGGAVACLLPGLRRVCDPELYDRLVTGHDAYHHERQAWTDRLGGSEEAVIRRWLVEIHGRLAGAATAEERRVPAGLLDTLLDLYAPDDPSRFLTLRDLAEFMGTDTQEPKWGLAKFCVHTAAHLSPDSPLATGLRELPEVRGMVPRARTREYAALLRSTRSSPNEVTTLFGIILPEEGPRVDDRSSPPYRVELARKTGDREIVALDGGRRCADYAEATAVLKRELDRVLHDIYRRRDTVEIVIALPDEHLGDEPLYTWQRPDARPFAKFLMRLRRSCTWEKSGEQIAELEDRWEVLQRWGIDAVEWFDCADPRGRDLPALQELFVPEPSPAAIAVTEVPTAQMLTAAHSNSVPVTIWRNDRCAVHYDAPASTAAATRSGDTPPAPAVGASTDDTEKVPCAGAVFRRRVEESLAGLPPVDWYTTVWNNQRDARPSTDERDRLWRTTVFILDIPGQSKRRPHPLAGPRSS
ncbi:trypsin-like peptidase domain-containing protein [Nocardia paucivorans]|uniref:trypsin-like peptidase domain-containing protein n=1 Tax=Nocardia paucivorans TaxID=114259 RepID=UPI00030CC24F|nr:trypsin-like peptidase domain-containing protein [Nocardia paucivorans]